MILILDNNILFSIINPNSVSAYLFTSIKAKFIAPEFIKLELEKHKQECLSKSKLSEHEFELRQAEIEKKIDFIPSLKYKDSLVEATSLISDLNDIDFLALALSISDFSPDTAIWSNDPDLKQQSKVRVLTTSELIKMFLLGKI